MDLSRAGTIEIQQVETGLYTLRRFRFMRADIVAGAVFPDYELTDHAGKTSQALGSARARSDDSGAEPRRLLPEGSPAGGGTGPTSSRNGSRLLPPGHDQHGQFGCDERVPYWRRRSLAILVRCRVVSSRRICDIAEYTDATNNPMIPHTIVLEPGLIVFKIYNGYWYFGRPTIEELRQDLRAVLKKCRPDWDITSPEMKAPGSAAKRIASIRTARATPRYSASKSSPHI